MNAARTTTFQGVAPALQRLNTWIENEQFQGWDPHDALNSPLLRRVAGQNRVLGAALVQLLRHSPVNLRPLLGVRKGYNPKAMGLFLASYAEKFLKNRAEESLERIRFFSDWLVKHALPGYAGLCWGYHFDWPNRSFFAPVGTPTIVNTAFLALALLDAEPALERLGRLPQRELPQSGEVKRENACWQNAAAVSMARSACEFILRDLQKSYANADEICFSYTPFDRRFVHNANLLGAWLLASVCARTGEKKLAESARAAARFTAFRQRDDGSWPYGIDPRDQWVDNFHTGYVLVALKRIAQLLQTDEFSAALRKGYLFWKERMFVADTIPKYYPDRTYPVDIHCVAQAILTFLEFSDLDRQAQSQADQVCRWAIENLQDAEGFFHYQIRRWYRIRIPYMRWGQAWMQLALTKLVYRAGALSSLSAASGSV